MKVLANFQQKRQFGLIVGAIATMLCLCGYVLFCAIASNTANADSGISCFYTQTGVSSATIKVTGASSFSASSDDETVATTATSGDTVTVTGADGAVGIANINIAYGSSTYTVQVPVGYTVFSFDEDDLTVMEGNSTNYEIDGIDYTAEDTVEITPTEVGSNKVYSNTESAKVNVNLKKKGGTYVFTGSSDNMSISVSKEAATTSTLLMASCHLTSQITSPLTIKKSGTVQTVVTALTGHSNSLADVEFNNADLYGESGTTSTANQYWAESAVIKGKASANLLLNGSGNLTLTCNSKNAVKIGESGNVQVENVNLNIVSTSHGISSDNTSVFNSGSVTVNSVGDAIRSDPDSIVSGTTTGSIEINGGTFNITTNSDGDGIQSASTMYITGGCFNLSTGNGSSSTVGDDESSKGIKAGSTMGITGGDFVLDCADDAIHADGNCTITGGSFNISTGDDGIHAGDSDTTEYQNSQLTLGTSGSSYPYVNITKCYEGLEGPQIAINSGTYSIVGSDDGVNAANGIETSPGTSAGCNLVVSGGNIYVNVDGDGFDANGNITISGGTCVVFGETSNNGDNNPYDSDGSFTINGGIVFGAGGNNPPATTPSGSQSYVRYGVEGGGGPTPPGPRSSNASETISSGKTIVAKYSSSGSTAFSVKTPKAVNYVIYSDSSMTSSGAISSDTSTPT